MILLPFSFHALGTYLLRPPLFLPLAVHIHLILWLENRPDLAEQVPQFFLGHIYVLSLHDRRSAGGILFLSPILPLSAQLQTHQTNTPPSLHPAPFHTALGLAETHTPLSPSLRPPYTPYQPGARRTARRRKRNRKSCVCPPETAADCHLALTMYTHHPQGAAFTSQTNGTFCEERRAAAVFEMFLCVRGSNGDR